MSGPPKKPRDEGPVNQTDVELYLAARSDFAFEMAVLSVLRSNGYTCSHAGTYPDPITEAVREYDIRAVKNFSGLYFQIRLAVECTNIRERSPIVVHATPRLSSESFLSVFVKIQNTGDGGYSRDERVTTDERLYGAGMPVGRTIDQPKDVKVDGPDASDKDTYAKWLQTLNATSDILKQCVADVGGSFPRTIAIVPLLVVPNDRLWQVDYDENGSRVAGPRLVKSATHIVQHRWTHMFARKVSYAVSHVEIVTIGALAERLGAFESPDGSLAMHASDVVIDFFKPR